jgi:putative ubiquitin-RnfH superfamily antitoxin RatB of RatAB toxin-antitoxin module
MRSAEDDAGLGVSVVYLRPGLAFEKALRLPAGASVGAAIEASGIRDTVAELADGELEVGVFSQLRKPADPLYDGDRVEIYRPLTIDPKEARRVRVAVRRRRKASRPLSGG